MGLFGRFSRKAGDRKPEGSGRCTECGMTGGEHTDWCPAVPHEEPGIVAGTTPEPYPGAESQGKPDPQAR